MTQNIEITIASKRDLSEIQYLFRKMFELSHIDQNIEYPYTDQGIYYLQQCREHHMAFVAKDTGNVVGFLTGAIEDALPFKTYQQQGHLHNLFVLDAYRGQGIGKQLISQFIRECQNNRVDRIITDSDDTEPLRHFYTSFGFRITGVNYEIHIAHDSAVS